MVTSNPSISVQPKMEDRPVEPWKPAQRASLMIPILLACLLAVLIVGDLLNWIGRNKSVHFPTPYQAVLLTNGAVYYGNLQGYGTSNPVLTKVF